MHPNRLFEWTDRDAMLAFVGEVSFATIFVETGQGSRIVHAPLLVAGPDRIRFHISRRNAAAVEGARAFISCLGPHAYVSPDWYGSADQVPTWNYVSVECEGPLEALGRDDLVTLLDDLSAAQEARLAPKRAWTRSKMSPGRFDAMLEAIVGYEMKIEQMRGTRKLGQNKSEAESAGARDALRALGENAIAALMEQSGQ